MDDLTEDQRNYLRNKMCPGASLELRKCNSCDNRNDIDIATVLLGGEKGLKHSARASVVDGTVSDTGWIFPFSERRSWIVPEDAGVTTDERLRVEKLNKATWKCSDAFEATQAPGSFANPYLQAKAWEKYEKCLRSVWEDYYD